MRPIQRVVNSQSRIEPETVIHRGLQIDRIDGIGRRVCRILVARAEHAASLNAAASKQRRRAFSPMVAAGIGVDLWSAAEFAETGDQRLLEQAALVKIA